MNATPYKNGKVEGIGKWYHENGNISLEVRYKSGRQEGVIKKYHENGNLLAEVLALNNKTYGDMKLYAEDGKLLILIEVENDIHISGKCFNGKVLAN
ncbi:toxin-antitoxin system YwqK family antitoxin [Helicobacter trogontum]|uniref:toxin-antitoxin system YwqK family antitoxin n=1 Tax=Helicobacter trogontum TaxID=50960 RepID=UPI003988D04D